MNRGKKVGSGTYGCVYVVEIPNNVKGKNKSLVIKRNKSDGSGFTHVLSETDILARLCKLPRIVSLEKIAIGNPFDEEFSPVSKKEEKEGIGDDIVHFFLERGDKNLDSWCREHRPTFSQFKMFILDLLLGVETINQSRILHRDLKPNNLVVFKPENDPLSPLDKGNNQKLNPRDGVNCQASSNSYDKLHRAKIIDFGLARPKCEDDQYTPDVTTSWYRSPESMSIPGKRKQPINYDSRVDSWACGCIIYELITGDPFMGIDTEDENEHLLRVLLSNPHYEFSAYELKTYLRSKNKKCRAPKTIRDRIEDDVEKIMMRKNTTTKRQNNVVKRNLFTAKEVDQITGDLADLIHNLLIVDPEKRFTIMEALNHPFFDTHRDYIERYRRMNRPRIPKEYPYRFVACKERNWGMLHAQAIWKNSLNKTNGEWVEARKFDWFSTVRIFHAIDMYDRVLRYLSQNTDKIIDIPRDHSSGKNPSGSFMTKKHSLLYFYVCLFMSIKNFSSIHRIVKIEEFIPDEIYNKACIKVMKKIEVQILVDIFNYQVFRHTIYEEINRKCVGLDISQDNKFDIYNFALKSRLLRGSDKISGVRPSEFAKELIEKFT